MLPARKIEPRGGDRIFAEHTGIIALEDGVTDLDEVLKVRLADIKADRDRARVERIKSQSPPARIDRGKIEPFGSLLRENITSGDV